MKESTRKIFDPKAWHRIYHQSGPSPSQQLFQRVTAEVFLAAQPYVKENQLWVDLGCGTGELSKQLESSGAQVVGIDKDPAMLDWCEQYIQTESTIKFLAEDATKTSFAGHSVDGVVAASLTGCLEELTAFWYELSRILVPGGYAIISFTNKQSGLLALVDYWRRLKTIKEVNHPCRGHFIRSQMKEVVHSASNNGLELLSYRYFNGFIDFANWSFPSVKLACIFESCSPQVVQKYTCRNFVMVLRSKQ